MRLKTVNTLSLKLTTDKRSSNMKNTIIKNWCKKLWMLCAFTWLACAAGAQINIHVTVLPPYYTHFTDYSSHPQQIMILVTNTSDKGKDVQLRGSITGDNGVEISVDKNFKNPAPLHVDAGATRTLNGNDINSLFDFNQLVYTGITRDKLMLQGNLPEGNYQVCVRAYDYNTNVPLSDDQPTGCSNAFPISSVEPPTIIKPTDGDALPVAGGQNFVITWSTPAGALPTTQYTVSIAEILDNRSPQVAMMSATNPMFYQATVTGTNVLLYNTAMPALTQGRRYALMITAKDPTNKITFRNNGQSEVVGFVYGDVSLPPDNGNVANGVVCSCAVPLPVNSQASTNISPGGVITAGNFSITVLSVFKNNNNTLSGTGKVNLPVANSSYIPVGVSFNNIQINSSNQLIRGVINAQVKSDVNFLPTVPGSNPNLMPFTSSDITNLSNYIDRNVSNTVSQLKSTAANTVFQLPIGLDKTLLGSPVTIEVTALTITPTQAVMDAATIINTPDDNVVSRIALGAKNLCVNPTDLCGDAKLFLAADVNLPSLNLTLKGAGSPDGGSYVVFDKSGFKSLQISADMALPQSLIVKLSDKASPVTAHFSVNTTNGWSDWMAQVKIDPFAITGNNDFGFVQVGDGMYDHSDIQNPAALPSIPEKPELTTPQWHGFYLPKLAVNLPAVLKTAQGQPITAAVQNLIIDGNGVSGIFAATNLLQIGDGSLGGWFYSIDNLGITIVNNGFKNGGMDGKLVLPVSDVNQKSAQLSYHSTLSNGANGSGIQFQFVMAPKNDLNFAVWAATAQIDQTSNITVVAGGANSFSAKATLNGHLSIDANLPVVGKVNFAQMKFEQFKLTTDNPYVDFGNTIFSLASPQHAIGGNTAMEDNMGFAPPVSGGMADFPVTLDKVSPYFADGKIGVKFTMSVKLADIAALPNASTTLSVYGKFKLDGARPKFFFDPGDAVQLDQIAIDGDLAALHIKGKVDFYNNDATFGNGFKGSVEATFPAISIGIASTVQFGAVRGFKYFYVDAMVDLGQAGIALGTSGLSIFGFGGGAYYHMRKPDAVPGPGAIKTVTPDDKPALGASVSGNVYTPDVNTSLGIKATLLFGLVARPTFNADVTMEVAFASSGGVAMFALEGNARILEVTGGEACIKGHIGVQFDFQNSIMQCAVNAKLSFPPVVPVLTGQFNAAFYFAPGKWYIKFGTPDNKNNITFLGILKYIESYMEVGNFGIDPMPPIPQKVRDVLVRSGVDPSFFQRPIDATLDRGEGFIFGADAGFDYSGSFAIFKISIGATIGFDVSLKKYSSDDDITCDNGQKTIGADGWYAMGQVYAGIWGSVDISTEFFGDINILDVGAGAVLMAGLPNPTYAAGAVGGYYSVLGGLISGHMHIEFTVGSKCTVSKDALSGLKLIGGITPVSGSKNMEILSAPAVAFNFNLAEKPGKTFAIMQDDGKGNQRKRVFRFNSGCVNTSLHDDTHNAYIGVANTVADDYTGITVAPTTGLTRLTTYTFSVSAHLEELNDDFVTWRVARYESGKLKGQDFIDTRTTTFTTNNGIKEITDQMVEYAYPLKWQRFFMPDEASTTAYGTGNAVIKLIGAVNPGSFDMNGPDQGYTQSFYGRVIPVVPSGAPFTFPITFNKDESGKIVFDLPAAQLRPNTVYTMQFIGRAVPNALAADISNNAVLSVNKVKFTELAGAVKAKSFTIENKLAVYQGTQNGSNSQDTIRSRSLNDQVALKTGEMLLYTIYFKTSTYSHFEEKGTNMPITHISYAVSGVPTTDDHIMSTDELADFAASHLSLRAYLAKKLLGITDTSAENIAYKAFTVDYLRDVYMSGNEYFDDYDVLGYNKTGTDVTGHNYAFKVTPLLSVDNSSTTGWLNTFTNGLLSQYNMKMGYSDINLAYTTLSGGMQTTHPVDKMDARNVGNIDMTVVNGGETAAFTIGQLQRLSFGGRIGGSFKINAPINYSLKVTFRKQVDYQPGHGAEVGLGNKMAEFLVVHGGDPSPEQMQGMGNVYDAAIKAGSTNNSVQGSVISMGYQLPGVSKVSAPKSLNIGNIGNIQKLGMRR